MRSGNDRVLGRAGEPREQQTRPAGRIPPTLAPEAGSPRLFRDDSVVRGGLLVGAVATTLTVILALVFLRGGDNVRDAEIPAQGGGQRQAASGIQAYTFDRVVAPDRTVVRDGDGAIVATFTDGARTVSLTGPERTFSEPSTTSAKVRTTIWVRLAPRQWRAGAEHAAWFEPWFLKALRDRSPDVLAITMQYLHGKPTLRKEDVRYAGDASFGPIDPDIPYGDTDFRLEQSDFYDFLGISWRFDDGVTERSEAKRYGAVDCSGYIRLVYGYRLGYPLRSDNEDGAQLPRRAFAMATVGPGVVVIPNKGTRPADIGLLQPGDLVFFDIDRRDGSRIDHSGIYLGLDTDGHPRFISSREQADGPTFGDVGGTAVLDGDDFYARLFRTAKRL
jgi:cell wall-associated NlpC family hydrolase